MQNNIIHIGIGFDQNYYNQFCALIASLFENHPKNKIHLHVIVSGVGEDEKERIINYCESFGKINFYSANFDEANRFVLLNNWTSAVYYRLYFPLLLKDYERMIYLDTDIVVMKDLSSFFNLDLHGKPVAAVYDNYVKTQPLIGIVEEGKYFNSGMLLIDIREWNKQGISQKAVKYLNENPGNIRFVDQCALNAVLKDNWQAVGKEYNLLFSYVPFASDKKQLEKFLSGVYIIHYTLERPWKFLCRNRLRNLYAHYLKNSPLANGKKVIDDFSFDKIGKWIKLRALEFYFDYPALSKLNKLFKRNF